MTRHHASLANRIVTACNVEGGLSLGEIFEATGGKRPTVGVTVPQLVLAGRLYKAGVRMHFRYFAQEVHAVAFGLIAPGLYAAHRAQRAEEKAKTKRDWYHRRQAELRATQPARPPKQARQAPRPKPAKKASTRPRKSGITLKNHRDTTDSVAHAATVTWPAHVQVQRAPTPRDDRFTFTPPPGWRGEFGREWRQRRRVSSNA